MPDRQLLHAKIRPILVGEAPGPSSVSHHPLFPEPAQSAGGRLQRALGVGKTAYLRRFQRTNLLYEYPGKKWREEHHEKARSAALCVLNMGRWTGIYCFGRNVLRAFGAEDLEFFQHRFVREHRTVLVAIPHPSGRNRLTNNVEYAAKIREAVRAVTPWALEEP